MKSKTFPKIIMIMLDGVGIPPEGWRNSDFLKYCGEEFVELFDSYSIPVDACLDVPGLPQSATGQCSLFCGVNASQIMGRHVQGFPGPQLRNLIREKNIFKSLKERGKKICFANAYVRKSLEELKEIGFCSVTSVMTESVLNDILRQEELIAGNAVFHDLTRESIADAYPVGIISPEAAAEDLLGISRDFDFTLFEYFMTDRAGHKRIPEMFEKALTEMGSFICQLAKRLPADTLLLVTSDHGNCEDLSKKSHTDNPVPFLVYGQLRPRKIEVASLVDVHDWILSLDTQEAF
jgi:hypothetical protein